MTKIGGNPIGVMISAVATSNAVPLGVAGLPMEMSR